MMSVKRLHVYYSGSVQGVGFRYTVERLAVSLGIKGWVQNLSDGRVEVICEGEEKILKEFLKKIKDVFEGYVSGIDSSYGEALGEFEGFDIRF